MPLCDVHACSWHGISPLFCFSGRGNKGKKRPRKLFTRELFFTEGGKRAPWLSCCFCENKAPKKRKHTQSPGRRPLTKIFSKPPCPWAETRTPVCLRVGACRPSLCSRLSSFFQRNEPRGKEKLDRAALDNQPPKLVRANVARSPSPMGIRPLLIGFEVDSCWLRASNAPATLAKRGTMLDSRGGVIRPPNDEAGGRFTRR